MHRVLWLAVLALPLALVAQAGDSTATFFDGKDLDGWEGLTEYWSVKDGAIVGKAKDLKFNTFLCSKKTYKDFELKFQVKLTGDKDRPNSGVQIRSKIHDMKRFAVTGPQCDMGAGWWGSLYGENFGGMMKAADASAINKVLKKGDFNDYSIKCVGKHVTIQVNGVTSVDDDFAKLPDEGIIAFQMHGNVGPMEVIFKDIHFKDLTK